MQSHVDLLEASNSANAVCPTETLGVAYFNAVKGGAAVYEPVYKADTDLPGGGDWTSEM